MTRARFYTPLLLLGQLMLFYLAAFAYVGVVACYDSSLPLSHPPWEVFPYVVPGGIAAWMIYKMFKRGLRQWAEKEGR